VPEALSGRAFAAYNGARNGAGLGALAVGGVLVGAIGQRAALALAGLAPLIIGRLALTVIVVRCEMPDDNDTRRNRHAFSQG
jgi:hypothetical protein